MPWVRQMLNEFAQKPYTNLTFQLQYSISVFQGNMCADVREKNKWFYVNCISIVTVSRIRLYTIIKYEIDTYIHCIHN